MAAAMAREASLTNEERIIRENLSRPFPRYDKETSMRLASECVTFKLKLCLNDVEVSDDPDTKK